MNLRHFAKLLGLSLLLFSSAFAPSCGGETKAPADMTPEVDMMPAPDLKLAACPVESNLAVATLPCDCFGTTVTQTDIDGCNKTFKCCPAKGAHCE